MKIAILTQPLRFNYGGLLQNYALQQILIRDGHNVETIWYETQCDTRFRMWKYRCKMWCKHLLFPQKYSLLKYTPTDYEWSVICRNTEKFINKYIIRSQHPVLVNSLEKYSVEKNFDVYIAGSDQCWRPKYNGGALLPAMFLDFVSQTENVKRIAYAASFGTEEWEMTPEMTSRCATLVKKFDFVSVREEDGVGLCSEFFGVKAKHVLDPTMLLTKEDYLQLVKAENEPESDGNLFTYILDPNAEKMAFVSRMAELNDLEPFSVMPEYQYEMRTRHILKHYLNDCAYPRVTTWLRAFADAKMIIVDSFHGMVFSIIFNKPFLVIGNRSRGLSRFTSLLNMFGLQDRLIDENELESVDKDRLLKDDIDWTRVNNILSNERSECLALLRDVI